MPRSSSPRRSSSASAPFRAAVTLDRCQRLCRLLRLLAGRPQARDAISQKLKVDIRGFYRDLGVLRDAGIAVALAEGKYALSEDLSAALDRLPFPDPMLTVGEARHLARGTTPAHRRMQEQLDRAVT